jgi:hydroxyacylglutathione hydrolase
MLITAEAIPILSDNYAWLLRDGVSGAVAVVDPADAEAVAAAVRALGLRIDLILLTHHHADHVAGTDALRAEFGCPVIGASADAHRLPKLNRAVREGDVVAVGRSSGEVLATPGHTRGHIAYYFPDGPLLVCGDTLFSLGCGRLVEGTAEEMFASLRKLAALPPETVVLCGHEYTEANARFALTVEPDNAALQARAAAVRDLRRAGRPTVPSVLSDELAANPFLRVPDAATFADIRARKDRF